MKGNPGSCSCYVRPHAPTASPHRRTPGLCQQRDVPLTRCCTASLLRTSAGDSLAVPGEQPVELVREHLALALTERRRPARIDTAATQLIEKITHGESLAHIFLGIQLPAGIQSRAALLDHRCRQRDVRGY